MKKIAFALSIVLSISLMGCAATTTTKGVDPASAPVQAQAAKVADPVTTQSAQVVPPVPTPLAPGKWTTTNTWSGDGNKVTDAFSVNGNDLLITRESTGKPDIQIDIINDKGVTVYTIDRHAWDGDKKTSILQGLVAGQYTFKITTTFPWTFTLQQKPNQDR